MELKVALWLLALSLHLLALCPGAATASLPGAERQPLLRGTSDASMGGSDRSRDSSQTMTEPSQSPPPVTTVSELPPISTGGPHEARVHPTLARTTLPPLTDLPLFQRPNPLELSLSASASGAGPSQPVSGEGAARTPTSRFMGRFRQAAPRGRKAAQRYQTWWIWYRANHEGPWPDIFHPPNDAPADYGLSQYFKYTSRIEALDAIRRQVLSGLTAGLRRDDYLRLKQTFHPWIKVDINHFSYRSEEYESLIEAEKLLAQEMEQILERVARLN